MFFLGKIFVQLASPLGLCLLLTPLGAILIWRGNRKFGWSLITFAFAWLLTWSLPVASIPFRQGLERQFPQQAAASYPAVDAIVVLGGGIQGGRKGWRVGPHLGSGADRAWFGAQLYHAGRAPVLILSGGNSSWSGADESESEAMEMFEKALDVPSSAVLIEDQSRNTPENAQYTKQLMDEHHFARILLVTSAAHMPRALGVFRAAGIDAVPAPTDFDAIPPLGFAQNWLPDTETLDRSNKAMKEYIAMGVYRIQELAR